MVLLTDGNQTGTDLVPDQTPLVDAIQPIKNLGVKVVAIGIGSVDRNQLSTLVDSQDDILTPKTFDELLGLVRTTVEKSCRGMYVTELPYVFLSLSLSLFRLLPAYLLPFLLFLF